MDARSDSLREGDLLRSAIAELEQARISASEVAAEISASRQELRLLVQRLTTEESLRAGLSRMTEAREIILHRLDAIYSESTQASARELRMNQALAESGRRIAELTRSVADAEAAHAAIENSRSWRRTRPLQVAQHALRASFAWLADAMQSMLRLPVRGSRHSLQAVVEHLRAHPRRKELAKRLLSRSGRIGTRLRNVARETSYGALDTPRRPEPPMGQPSRDPSATREIASAARASTSAERLAIERRMAYVAELETRLDEQGRRHREELERLLREVGRLHVAEPRP